MSEVRITAEQLRERYSFEPMTGQFAFLKSRRGFGTGKAAGWFGHMGYRVITIDGRNYRAHRLAWLYVHGVWPTHTIDHINGNKADNRIANLRDVPQQINRQNVRSAQRNNRLGFLGVDYRPDCGKYVAKISLDGEQRYLGRFDTAEQAHAAYIQAKRMHHPGSTL